MTDALQQAFTNHTVAILIIMVTGLLLGLLWGWILFGKYKSRMITAEQESSQWHAKYTDMEKDFMSLRYEKEELDKQVVATKTSLRRCDADKSILEGKLSRLKQEIEAGKERDLESGTAPVLAFAGAPTVEAAPARIDYANIFSSDNLKIIEGIGPKVETLLKSKGIHDWNALAATSPAHLREILQSSGSSYHMQNPETWPHQAQLAQDGQWEALIRHQKTANAEEGKNGMQDNPSKVEILARRVLGFSNNPEDLKIIEGIGPKIERLLKDGGINNWSDLAATSVIRLQEILMNAGNSFSLATPSSWPKQAELAASGKWSELHEYQEYLQGGKELA